MGRRHAPAAAVEQEADVGGEDEQVDGGVEGGADLVDGAEDERHEGVAVDLEELASADPVDLPDDEVAARLLALPGVGPYAAAHVMMLVGRYSRLVLDSWTRPKFASLNGGKTAKDKAIERRFRRYGRYSGLAFWLFLTRDWVAEPA